MPAGVAVSSSDRLTVDDAPASGAGDDCDPAALLETGDAAVPSIGAPALEAPIEPPAASVDIVDEGAGDAVEIASTILAGKLPVNLLLVTMLWHDLTR